MENLEWVPVFYNGIETNLEVTRFGRVRRVKKDWYGKSSGSYLIKYGEIDLSKLKLHPFGYNCVGIQMKGSIRKTLLIHQLIASVFLDYKWGISKNVIDHIDSNKQNNRVDNLRIITQRENTSKERTKKSGLPAGVYLDKKTNKYVSQIYFNKKRINLGRYNTIEEASNAYQNKLNSIT